MKRTEIDRKILFKPNPILEGIFKNNSGKDYYIFNSLLYIAQRQKIDSDYMAVVSYKDMKDLINNKNIATIEKIKTYLDENFRKETIRWKYNYVETITGLITKIQFNEVDMSYYLTIDKDLVEYLIQYSTKKIGYTPIDVSKRSKNFYAMKIYEYLRKWSGEKQELTVTLLNFKQYLNIEDKYNDFRIFRRDLLNPALKEIKEKYNMTVTFETIKVRNSVHKLYFKFIDNEPRRYNFTEYIDAEFTEVSACVQIDSIQRLLKELDIKIAVSTTNKLKRKYGEELVVEGIHILDNKLKVGKLKAPVSYLKATLENLYLNERYEGTPIPTNYDYLKLEDRLLYGLQDGETSSDILKPI